MRGYVVTLMNIPQSVQAAERCIESAKQFNINTTMFPAVWKNGAIGEMEQEYLYLSKFDTTYSDVKAVVGNFVTQYRIWNKIIERNEPGIVLEHDAVFVDKVPDLSEYDIVNIGKPSFGNYQKQSQPGVYPLFSKPGGYFPGAHGYYVSPKGAKQLVDKAKQDGVAPCDIFLSTKNFSNLMELYPWVVEAHDDFTTIQNEKGCLAKHNYDKNYKILKE